ncbi:MULTISPECIES: hypothetical protein [Amycolatopsis]|uniref:Uncharacterized protein n=1 Tax=Amycolatopsis tucumanensis TaxID=401106 RepID=A0ABP7JCE9_9PSEU|nr:MULTISPECIES: hypothetical protein [Amycolatopsis]MCF6424267.1 hypothetical protein [Amycolatopsis tucumanensis]
MNVRRFAIASLLAIPLSFGAAGIASADSYGDSAASAGPDGAAISSTGSVAGHHYGYDDDGYGHGHGWGYAGYYDANLSAGPEGAGGDYTVSGTNGHTSFYGEGCQWAGPEGAHSSETWSVAGHHHHDHDWDDDEDEGDDD